MVLLMVAVEAVELAHLRELAGAHVRDDEEHEELKGTQTEVIRAI